MARHSSKLMGTLLVAAVLVAAAGRAEALTVVNSPFGNAVPVDVVIGSQTLNLPIVGQVTVQSVIWRSKLTRVCQVTSLGGPTGLNDDYQIQLTKADDWFWIPAGSWSISDCHGAGGPLNYAGHYLDVYTLGGNDTGTGGLGNGSIFGGSGDDMLASYSPTAVLFGDSGNDTLVAASMGGASETISGGEGDDCLEDRSHAASSVDCGPGTDVVAGFTVGQPNCEGVVRYCP